MRQKYYANRMSRECVLGNKLQSGAGPSYTQGKELKI
jgi:hypothetical protein